MRNIIKEHLLAIFNAAVAATQPDTALLSHLRFDGKNLILDGNVIPMPKGRLVVLGAGKGAAPMAKAVENLLHEHIDKGLLVVKYDHSLPLDHIEIVEASHPVPDKAGEEGARRLYEMARECGPDDLILALITGGASALLPAPAHGLTLEDLQKLTSLLLGAGADIGELNAIRKHLSYLSGGQLAKAANGATVIGVIVSDVIGDDLKTIASGPTVPDATTFADCLAILDRYGLRDKIPQKARLILEAGLAGELPETPKQDDPVFKKARNVIVASNLQALKAASIKAHELGYEVMIEADPYEGEASETVKTILRNAQSWMKDKNNVCYLAGGETTVTIRGSGKGGRNQQMALEAFFEMTGKGNMGALFAGTDGTDGPTDAAGGFAFGDSLEKIGGIDEARKFLENNDSYYGLQKAGELLITGPTRTNVMDMAIVLKN